jgi:hypothetical protein
MLPVLQQSMPGFPPVGGYVTASTQTIRLISLSYAHLQSSPHPQAPLRVLYHELQRESPGEAGLQASQPDGQLMLMVMEA